MPRSVLWGFVTQRSLVCADSSTELTMKPQPTEAEIQFILDAISEYLTVKVQLLPADSIWMLRRFVCCPGQPTAQLPALDGGWSLLRF